jgi:hypothetical protein
MPWNTQETLVDHLLNCHGEWNALLQAIPFLGAGALMLRAKLRFIRIPAFFRRTPQHDCRGHK